MTSSRTDQGAKTRWTEPRIMPSDENKKRGDSCENYRNAPATRHYSIPGKITLMPSSALGLLVDVGGGNRNGQQRPRRWGWITPLKKSASARTFIFSPLGPSSCKWNPSPLLFPTAPPFRRKSLPAELGGLFVTNGLEVNLYPVSEGSRDAGQHRK